MARLRAYLDAIAGHLPPVEVHDPRYFETRWYSPARNRGSRRTASAQPLDSTVTPRKVCSPFNGRLAYGLAYLLSKVERNAYSQNAFCRQPKGRPQTSYAGRTAMFDIRHSLNVRLRVMLAVYFS